MTNFLLQSLRFGAVGLINTAIGLVAIYSAIFFFLAGPVVANVFGYSIGFFVSFVLNRLWTFDNKQPISRVLPRYLLVAGVSYMLNLSAVLGFVSYSSSSPYFSQLMGVTVYTVFMFLGCRWFVFAPR